MQVSSAQRAYNSRRGDVTKKTENFSYVFVILLATRYWISIGFQSATLQQNCYVYFPTALTSSLIRLSDCASSPLAPNSLELTRGDVTKKTENFNYIFLILLATRYWISIGFRSAALKQNFYVYFPTALASSLIRLSAKAAFTSKSL